MVLDENFKENINIFRTIRKYSEALSKKNMTIQDLYGAMGNIIHEKLQIDVAIYRSCKNLPQNSYKMVYASPPYETLPKQIDVDKPTTDFSWQQFEGPWWLMPFGIESGNLGYIGLHLQVDSESMTLPVQSIVISNLCESQACRDASFPKIAKQPYIIDLIVNIVEHFDNSLAEIVILQRNRDLIAELKAQNEALLLAREENKSALRQGREWVSVMSHEIRTPLFAINSLSELLLERFTKGKDDKGDTEMVSSLELIVNSAKHLTELVNNILDFTKLEADQLELEQLEFDIRSAICDCVAINVRNDQRLYPHTCIFIDKDVPKIVVGDEIRVKQIVMNLLSNAVKFTPDEGVVKILVSCTKGIDTDIHFTIRVTDTGIGIKEEDRDKVFKPFSQTDASITRKFGGSGLGLSICKKLCHLMKGDIYFEANHDAETGTIFTVKIVLQLSPNVDYASISDLSKTVPHEVTQWKFLIIDDNEVSRSCNKYHLDEFGIRNVIVSSKLPYIEEEKSGEDYDVYMINTRTQSVIENVDLLKKKVYEQQDRVILQNYPYAKKMLDLNVPIMAEIFGPVTDRELQIALRTLAERRGLSQTKSESQNDLKPLNIHILVAEDNAINQSVIKKLLEKFGITADFANNGQEAVDFYKIAAEPYKVILMDIMMPVMDGYTASKLIRKLSPHHKNPYIIALTANVFWEDRLHAMEAGMNDFITKPVKLKALYDVINKAVADSAQTLAGDARKD